jgi:hypothetical protein
MANMTDRILAISGNWALGADRLQWILMRRHSQTSDRWDHLSFVSSTRAILERCMRDKGVPKAAADVLLANLPPTFNEWSKTHSAGSNELIAAL